jgi:sec-independent protein translocase protein TatA
MGGWTGIWQWVIVLVIVLVLFGGRGKISSIMGDIGEGLRKFKSGLKSGDAEEENSEDAKPLPREAEAIPGKSAEKNEAAKS